MKIHFNNTEIDLPVNDNSYRYRAIKGEHSLTLYFSMVEHIEIPIGAYCIFEGERYTLEKPENFKMHNSRNFEYTLIMDSPQERLSKYKFKDTTSRRLKFSLTEKPLGHLEMLVENLNQRDSGWSVGEYIEATEKVISYNHAYCLDALTQMADAFETEWEIVGKKISLRKVEYNKENPLPLSYGRGNGFKSGVGRANEGSGKPIEILFVQGGDRNINPSAYGSSELLLPKNQTLEYEGRTYVSDSDGYSIRRADKPLTSGVEDSLDCSHIYPSRVGEVSSVVVVDAEKHFYDFIDNTIPEDLDFGNCRMNGETVTIIFQSGMLTGKEFEVEQTKEKLTGYIHSERRFKLAPQEIDGQTMPNDAFKPAVTDKYAVFGISLPDAYVCNNTDKTGASWDMFREAAKFLYENEGQKFTFTGELDGIWAKKDWLNIGGRIKLGGYILFSDNQFQPDGVSIRIVGIKDFINNPHSPVIELSNSVVGGSITSSLRKIESNEVLAESMHKEALQFTKRRYRDSVQTMTMLENALLKNFTNSISPITVQTMAMLVGDESLQFRFVGNETNPTTVAHNVKFDNATKVLTASGGIVQHMTIGIKALSSSHEASEYRFWDVPPFNSIPLTEEWQSYYLYIEASKSNSTATFILSESAIEIDSDPDYYHLLVGSLNSAYDGERSYVDLYGYTEILPGRMTTDRIVSADGQNFIDFLNNAARIGNSDSFIDFNSKKDGKLRIRGTILQDGAGDEIFVGVFRGAHNKDYTYHKGDEVTYTSNGNTSTYRYINSSPTSGTLPTDTIYWQVVAQGAQGATGAQGARGSAGDYFEYRYRVDGSSTSPPTLSVHSDEPSGWSTTMPLAGAMQYIWCTVARKSALGLLYPGQQWSTPTRITGTDGKDGSGFRNRGAWVAGRSYAVNDVITYKGCTYACISANSSSTAPDLRIGTYWELWASSPAMVYRGVYNRNDKNVAVVQTYYGTRARVDCVKYNNGTGDRYYIARTDAGNGFSNRLPTDTLYWNEFGAQFESIATNLLLAENANIANFQFSNQVLRSQQSSSGGIANIIMNGITGYASFGGGRNVFNPDGSGGLADGNLTWDTSGHLRGRSLRVEGGHFSRDTTFVGTLNIFGGIQSGSSLIQENYEMANSATMITLAPLAAGLVITLPPSPPSGQAFHLKNISSVHSVTLRSANSSINPIYDKTAQGLSTIVLPPEKGFTMVRGSRHDSRIYWAWVVAARA